MCCSSNQHEIITGDLRSQHCRSACDTDWFCAPLQGQAVDIRIHAEEMRRMANRLYEIYSKHTGQPTDVIGESQLPFELALHAGR